MVTYDLSCIINARKIVEKYRFMERMEFRKTSLTNEQILTYFAKIIIPQ